jgi:hypothetical protein
MKTLHVCCRCRCALLPCTPCTPCAAIAAPGDDGNYGSAATLDVLCLQALSKRIHYGKFVAEAKFRWVRGRAQGRGGEGRGRGDGMDRAGAEVGHLRQVCGRGQVQVGGVGRFEIGKGREMERKGREIMPHAACRECLGRTRQDALCLILHQLKPNFPAALHNIPQHLKENLQGQA